MGSQLRYGLDKIELAQKAKLLEVKTAVQSSQVQTEKLLAEVVILHDKLNREIENVNVAHRLELDTEFSLLLKKHAYENREHLKSCKKIDEDTQAVTAKVEASKLMMVRYIIGAFMLICGAFMMVIPISPEE